MEDDNVPSFSKLSTTAVPITFPEGDDAPEVVAALVPSRDDGAIQPLEKSHNALAKAMSGRLGLLVLDALTGVLCARMLRPEGRGELAAMILWPVFLCQACTLGIPSALIYRMRSKPQRSGDSLAAALVLAVLASGAGIAIGYAVLPHWLTHYRPAVVDRAQWFMFASPISMLVLIGRGTWEARGEFGRSALSLVLTRVLTLLSLVGLLAAHGLNPISAAYTYLLTGLPAVAWMLWAMLPGARWNLRPMIESGRQMMQYGLRSYGIDLCGALSQYVDQALVLGMLSPVAMGSYTVCLSLSRILNAVAVSASTVLFPRSIGATPEQATRSALRTLVIVTAITSVGAVGMLVLGRVALNVVYGHEYGAAAGVLKLLILEAMLSGTLNIMSQPFMALGRPGVVTVLQIAGLLFSIPAIIVLVPRMGTEGACIALVASACLRLALLAVCYARLMPAVLHWRNSLAEIATDISQKLLARTRGWLPV